MHASLLLRSDLFLKEVQALVPPWRGGFWSLERYLRAFDESGTLRPIYRVTYPEDYAVWVAKKDGLEIDRSFSASDDERFLHWQSLISQSSDSSDDPEAPALADPPPEFAPFVHRVAADDRVVWSELDVIVVMLDGNPVKRERSFAYYGAWQRYRCWALLEHYTFKALLDPRRAHPKDIFEAEWDGDLKGRMLTWTAGEPRCLKVIESLESDEWLQRLYLAREIFEQAQWRVLEPSWRGWSEGEALTIEERAVHETNRSRERSQVVGAAWLTARPHFVERLRLLLELWFETSRHGAQNFSGAIKEDLFAGVRWANQLYGVDSEQLDAEIRVGWRNIKTGLLAVLRPSWWHARKVTQHQLARFLESANEHLTPLSFDKGDIELFQTFLESEQLWSWNMEFSQLIDELTLPSDLTIERRFLHLRSLALLNEPVLRVLANRFGTPEDQRKFSRGSVMEAMKVFLTERNDWRSGLWEHIRINWEAGTQTRSGTLQDRLNEIEAFAFPTSIGKVTKTILTLGAVRNFGSHQMTQDAELWRTHRQAMIRGVVLTPLFYWKIATTLG